MREALILDLDGTVLTVNSFRHWAMWLVHARFRHLGAVKRGLVTLSVVRALVQRRLGYISHETLKWRLQRTWQAACAGDGGASEQEFAVSLLPYLRPELNGLLAAAADGRIDAVLATAAAGDYAYAFGRLLGFSHILATPRQREVGEPSNLGVCKRDAVIDFIFSQGWQDRALILFTDHCDDLPLIRICPTVFWFGSEEERRALSLILPGTALYAGFPGDLQKQSA